MASTCSRLTSTRLSELAALHLVYFSVVISQNTSRCPKCPGGMPNSLGFLHTQNMGAPDGTNILQIHPESDKKLLETELEQDLQTCVRTWFILKFRMVMRKLLVGLLLLGKKKQPS